MLDEGDCFAKNRLAMTAKLFKVVLTNTIFVSFVENNC